MALLDGPRVVETSIATAWDISYFEVNHGWDPALRDAGRIERDERASGRLGYSFLRSDGCRSRNDLGVRHRQALHLVQQTVASLHWAKLDP